MRTLDCRLACIQGYEAHKAACDAFLNDHRQARVVAVLVTDDPGIFYCQYSFKWEVDDDYPLKMLQTASYLRRAWEHMAKSHGLSVVFVPSEAVLKELWPSTLARPPGLTFDSKGRVKPPVPKTTTPDVPAPASRGKGFLSTILGAFADRDWKTKLESRLKPLDGDDFIDPSVLPGTRLELRRKIVDEIREKSALDTDKFDDELRRLVELHRLVNKCHPAGPYAYYLQAQAMTAKTDAAVVLNMTAWMSCVDGLQTSLSFVESALPLSLPLKKELWDGFVEVEDATAVWRVFSSDPTYLVRHLYFRFGDLAGVAKSMAAKGTFPDSLIPILLEYGCWLADNKECEKAAGVLFAVSAAAIKVRDDYARRFAFRALDRVCEMEFAREDKKALLGAAERLAHMLGDTPEGSGNTALWSEYRMRSFRWQAQAGAEHAYKAARAFAGRHVQSSMRTAGFVCHFGLLLQTESDMHRSKGQPEAAMACLREAIALMEPLCQYKPRGQPTQINMGVLMVFCLICIDASNLASEIDVTLEPRPELQLVEAIQAFTKWEHYEKVTGYSTLVSDMPEAQLTGLIDRLIKAHKD